MMKSSHRSSDNKANYVPYIIVFGIDMTRVFFNTLLFSIGIKKTYFFLHLQDISNKTSNICRTTRQHLTTLKVLAHLVAKCILIGSVFLFYAICLIHCNTSHVGCQAASSNTVLNADTLCMTQVKLIQNGTAVAEIFYVSDDGRQVMA